MIHRHFIKKTIQQVLIAGCLVFSINAQTITPEQYIEQYKGVAVIEMKRMGVPAAITLAQGLLETESGNSALVQKSNNHFGIKCKSNWTGEGVTHDDDSLGECFRKYATAMDSYRDHSNFLRAGKHYAFLFDLDPTDYKGWAYGLKKAGYATNPKYPAILIRHIEKYNLQQYNFLGGVEELSGSNDQNVKADLELVEKNTATPISIATNDGSKKEAAEAMRAGYPDNINLINGSKCIMAPKGTSLLAIATRYSIALQRLLDINELEEDGLLDEDQLIFLQKKSTKGDRDFVLVRKTEMLYSIAQNNGIQLESLLAYNHLKEDGEVFSGTKLFLKPVAQSDKKINSAHSSGTVFHNVKAKEGLFTIAQKYSVSVAQLRDWNKLSSDYLQIGQQLIVSQ